MRAESNGDGSRRVRKHQDPVETDVSAPGSHSAPVLDEQKTDRTLLKQSQAYLAATARQGDPDPVSKEAWTVFFRTYHPLLVFYAAICHCSEADVDDCVQETWKKIIQRFPGFQYDPTRGRFRDWLFALVAHTVADGKRQRGRNPTQTLTPEIAFELFGQDGDPAVLHERQRLQAFVQRTLDELRQTVSLRSYQVLYLRSVQERTVAETAVGLKMTPQQVRRRHSRLKKQLGRLFELRIEKSFPESGNGQSA